MSTRRALLLLVAACTHEAAHEPARGSERAPCRAGSACDPGLTCLSDRCVRVPDVHCGPVTEALVSIELGNYASASDRAAKAAELRPKCEAQPLSDSEAECILASRSRAQLAQCPVPILMAAPTIATPGSNATIGMTGMPPDCIAYVAVLDRYATCNGVPAEARKAIADVIVQLKQNWSGLGANPMPPAVGDACRQGMQAVQQAMSQFGC